METAFNITDVLQKNNMARKMDESLTQLAAIDNVQYDEKAIDAQMANTVMDVVKTVPLAQEFFDSPMGDKSEEEMKKIVTTSLIVGVQRRWVKLPLKEITAEGLAASVDRSLTAAKTAYKVGAGKMTASDAIETQTDHAVVATTQIVNNVVDRVADFAVSKVDGIVDRVAPVVSRVGIRLVSAFPQTRTLAPYIPVLVERAKPIVKTLLKVGIRKVAEIAKPIVRKVYNFVANGVKKISRSVTRFLLG